MENTKMINKENNIAHSKYVLDNFEELIKSPKYTFKEPEYNEDGEVNMYWDFEELTEQ